MRKLLKIAALLACGVAALPAHASGFDGSTIAFQMIFPDLSSPYSTQQIAVVGAGVEFPNDSVGFYGADLGGTTLTLIDLVGGLNTPASFNGVAFSDIGNSLAAITGVSFVSGGFAGEQPVLTFDADHIFLNFQGISQATAPGTSYTYAVSFADSAVPEPASWAMMIGGFGVAGAAMRTRRRKTALA